MLVQCEIQQGPGLPLGLKCNANEYTWTVCTASVKSVCAASVSLPLVKGNYSEACKENLLQQFVSGYLHHTHHHVL